MRRLRLCLCLRRWRPVKANERMSQGQWKVAVVLLS